jgi:hypothetical protein
VPDFKTARTAEQQQFEDHRRRTAETIVRAHIERLRTSVELDRRALAHLIDWDADPAEISYYEAFSDPQVRLADKARRARAGQYLRRLRRRAYKS